MNIDFKNSYINFRLRDAISFKYMNETDGRGGGVVINGDWFQIEADRGQLERRSLLCRPTHSPVELKLVRKFNKSVSLALLCL
jgi:hypothetical protein